jgi:hypothetical protein
MKIFDYKFIILLGLTLVVYFIYKEVEHLHNSINKLEKDINLLSLQQLRQQPLYQSQQQKPSLPLPLPSPSPSPPQKPPSPSPPQQKLLSPSQQSSQQKLLSPSQQTLSPSQQTLSPQKIINIDLLPSKLFKDQIIACNKQSFPNMLNNENDNDNNIDTDSSIHLAIYSNDNDNEQYDEEHNSLLDNESCDHKFNYNEELIILNINTSNNNPISMMYDATTLNNSESSELSKSSETHELPELSVLLNNLPNDLLNKSSESSESSGLNDLPKSSESSESSGLNDLTNELLNKLPKSSESFELNDLSNLQKTSEIKPNYTKKSLESLKVPEIKIIAENNNVCLTKQINGNIKNKTKHELIEDIINAQK